MGERLSLEQDPRLLALAAGVVSSELELKMFFRSTCISDRSLCTALSLYLLLLPGGADSAPSFSLPPTRSFRICSWKARTAASFILVTFQLGGPFLAQLSS